MHATGLREKITDLLGGLQVTDLTDLGRRGLAIRHAVMAAELPPDLQEAIVSAYEQLGDGAPIDVAVRSSATAEDLPDASFAGQQETYHGARAIRTTRG
jgi:pyruvate,water dikinase